GARSCCRDGRPSRAPRAGATSDSPGSRARRIEPVNLLCLGAMRAPALCRLAGLALLAASLAACAREFPSLRELAGLPKVDDPSVEIKPAEPKGLLIKNPRFGHGASEPENIGVGGDKIPATTGTLAVGRS